MSDEEKIYSKIDEAVEELESLRAILILKRLAPNIQIYTENLDEMVDRVIKLLYDAQVNRIPF